MILTKEQILELLRSGSLIIENFKEESLGPVSYDFTIGKNVRYIDEFPDGGPLKIDITQPEKIGTNMNLPVLIHPGDAIVFTTEEIIRMPPYISGIVYARSSLTKLPILFNIPGLIDPGFIGSITGVMYNHSGCELLVKRMRICQVVFHKHYIVEEHYGVRKLSKNLGQEGENSLISKTDKEFES